MHNRLLACREWCGFLAYMRNLFILAVLAFSMCTPAKKNSSNSVDPGGKFDFQVQYLYSGETFYDTLIIRDRTMVRKYFNDDGKKCAKAQRSPCWVESELESATATLTAEELASLKSLVEETNFMVSDPDPHGLTGKGRFYAYIITVNHKSVEHRVVMGEFPGSADAPPASRRIYLRLRDLAKAKSLGN